MNNIDMTSNEGVSYLERLNFSYENVIEKWPTFCTNLIII